jgi:tetratricopeptide (TPR) repeat protein
MTRRDLPIAASNAKPSRWQPALRALLVAASVAALSALSPARAQDQAPADAVATCALPDLPFTQIVFGQSYSGDLQQSDEKLTTGEFMHRYAFQGRAGQQIDIRLQGNYDTYLIITGPHNFQQNNDDDGSTRRSRLSLTLPSDGRYYVFATSFGGGVTGHYTLTVQNADHSQQASLLSPPTSCTDLINAGNLSQFDLARALTRRSSLTPDSQNDSAFADADRAVAILREVGGHPQEMATALYWRAWTYDVRQDNANAISDLTEALRLQPNYVDAYLDRGWVYYRQNDPQHALADYNAALQINPSSGTAYNRIGRVQQDLTRDYAGAIVSYTRATQLNPQDAWSHVYLAQVLQFTAPTRYDEALQHYEQALKINPRISVTGNPAVGIANAYVDRSNALIQSGDNSGALQAANRAIALNANNALAYNNRGVAYQNLGQYASAISDFSQALSIDPNQSNARSNLASLQQFQQQQAQQQQAQAQQQAAQNQASANALTNLFLGGIAAAAGADANTVANVMTGNYAAAAAPPPPPVQRQQPQQAAPQQQAPQGYVCTYLPGTNDCLTPDQMASVNALDRCVTASMQFYPARVAGNGMDTYTVWFQNTCPHQIAVYARDSNGRVRSDSIYDANGAPTRAHVLCTNCSGFSEWWISDGIHSFPHHPIGSH